MTLSGKRVFSCLNNARTSACKIEDFVKYHGAVVVVFLEKNVDMIIMDRTLQRAAPAMKGNYLTRSQQFLRKSIRQSGSTSIQLFASKWNIPVIDHSKIFQVCKRALFQEKEIFLRHKRKLIAPFVKVEDHSRNLILNQILWNLISFHSWTLLSLHLNLLFKLGTNFM